MKNKRDERKEEEAELRPLELYIHIPFCIRKCAYCDFLSFPCGEEERSQYVSCLADEIEEAGAVFHKYLVKTIFIGGGTPSVLRKEQTEELLKAVKRSFFVSEDAEITTEVNPGTVDEEKLKTWKKAGINRLSFGLQSTENQELKYLGRIHTMEDFLEGFRAAREAGFENINVDLMSALPGQTVKSWECTLQQVAALSPEHISAYSLIIEEGTPFYEIYGEDGEGKKDFCPLSLPSEVAERKMYYDTERILRESGYCRYEISNYAKPGYECQHNRGYWTGIEYLGLGLGSSSYIKEEGEKAVRFSNERDFNTYLSFKKEDFQAKKHVIEKETLTTQAQMEEFMFLGLRLMEGVSEKEFFKRFGQRMDTVYGSVLVQMERQGLMEHYLQSGKKAADSGRWNEDEMEPEVFWRLTARGIDVSNQVLAEFLLE